MDQQTHEEIEELKKRVDYLEQQTEPINVRIERGLPAPEVTLLQTIMTMVGTQATDIDTLKGDVSTLKGDVSTLKTNMEGARADIANIKATQSDHSEMFKIIAARLDKHEDLLRQILDRLPPKQ